ncbi:hypothetical protein [Schaalia hyovaginalis]|uniref:hypothetical protein n=1 Tax=Schaalia hyovaginalis TaxID=29316 RepID=UPI0038B27D62
MVTPKPGTATGSTTIDVQGRQQHGTVSFFDAFSEPLVPSADNPVRFIDPVTGEVSDATRIPAFDSAGSQIGTYEVDPLTGAVTFTPNADYVGTPRPATLILKDASGARLEAVYQPVVIPAPEVDPKTPAAPGSPEAVSSQGLASTGSQARVSFAVAAFIGGIGLLLGRIRRRQTR